MTRVVLWWTFCSLVLVFGTCVQAWRATDLTGIGSAFGFLLASVKCREWAQEAYSRRVSR